MSDLTAAEVLKLLPYEHPARFIDAIVELDPAHIVTKYTWRQEDCAGHFPGNPVVPGVKMLEMAAQTAISVWALYLTGARATAGRTGFFTRVEHVAFKKMVRPQETVVCRATFGKNGSFQDGRVMADVEITFLGGPKDAETALSGTLSGVWAPQDSENLI